MHELSALVDWITAHSTAALSPSASHSLFSTLAKRYANHWHEADAERGSAYRCLTAADPALLAFLPLDVGSHFRIWVDPGCVCYRLEPVNSEVYHQQMALVGIYGRLPARAASPEQLTEVETPTGPTPSSPSKRSKAIQIVHPSARKPSSNVTSILLASVEAESTALPALSIAPPTPTPGSPAFSLYSSQRTEDGRQIRPSGLSMPPLAFAGGLAASLSPPASPTRLTSRSSSPAPGNPFVLPMYAAELERPASRASSSRRSSHSRAESFASSISQGSTAPTSVPTRPSSACSNTSTKVTEHSGGKVGVLGGGTMLGVPQNKRDSAISISSESSSDEDNMRHSHKRNHTRSRKSSSRGSNSSHGSSNEKYASQDRALATWQAALEASRMHANAMIRPQGVY